MPEEGVYESSSPWDAQRPGTLVISCVDGRWKRHIQEFAVDYLKVGAQTDFVAVPGGIEPLTLFDFVPKDFNFLRRRLEAVVVSHDTRRIVAVAHQDCAWYKALKLGPLHLDLRQRQVADLRRAGKVLHEMFPRVAVETYFARLGGTAGDRVVFDRV
jgi:carbonic anhydrase